MQPAPRFAFGPFELDVSLRELRCHGEPVVIGPRLFDLLRLLIEQRHRVVPREELMSVVWGGRVTTPGVLPQAVLKLREALDDGSGTEWVRSLRGVGYRFVPEVQVLALTGPQRLPGSDRLPLVRLGILPCQNQTGESALQWLCLGLPSLTAQMLEADARLSLVGTASMMDYLRAVDDPAPADDVALRALRELGLDAVVQGRLTRQSGLLWLHGAVVTADGRRVPVASLRGPQWQSLSLRFAQAVQRLLLSTGPAAELEPISPDPFVVEAFARASELILRGEYTKARPLLQAVNDLEPDQPDVRLQLLRTLWVEGDPQAVAFGERLVEMLQRGPSRPSLRALAHQALAMAHLQCPGDAAMAAVFEQLGHALRLCEGHEEQDWALMVRINTAVLHGRRGDVPEAATEFERAMRLSRRTGNFKRLGQALTAATVGDGLGGRLVLARQRLEEAMDIWEQRVHHVRSAIHTELSLAEVEGLMGELDSAVEHADRALARLAAEGFLPYLASTVTSAAYLFLDRMDLPRARQVLALFGPAPDPRHPLIEVGLAGVRGLCHLLAGDDEAAVREWSVVHAKAEAANAPGFAVWRAWTVPMLRLAVRTRRRELRGRLEASIRGHAHGAQDDELRGVLAHAAAFDALEAGRHGDARAHLEAVARHPRNGREGALAALDLAWLLLDDARIDEAEDLLARTGPWREQHPLGRLVQARLLQERGDAASATEQHAGALRLLPGPQPAWACIWPDAAQPVPRRPMLPSALHFSPA